MSATTLPTKPYTVIRVTKATPTSYERTWVRGQRYWSPLGEPFCFTQDEAEKVLLSYEVLAQSSWAGFTAGRDAEVRRKAAEAVLDRVMEIGIPNDGAGVIRAAIREEVAVIARDFGVEREDLTN